MLAYDVSLAWSGLVLIAFGLVMVYSASIAMAEASAHTGYHAWYFTGPPRGVRHRWIRCCGDRVSDSGQSVAAARAVAVRRRRGAARRGARSGYRQVGQRCQALAAACDRQRAAVGVHEARRRALRGELCDAQGGVSARRASRSSIRCSAALPPVRGHGRDRLAVGAGARLPARSSSSSPSRSASCSWAGSIGGCSSVSPCCSRSRSRPS